MSTSATKYNLKKHTAVFVSAGAFALIFALIYNHFGHGVHSPYMDYMFLIPLMGAAVSFTAVINKYSPTPITVNLFCSCVATLTIASLMTGVTKIAGTRSDYILYLAVLGGVELVAAAISTVCAGKKKRPTHSVDSGNE